MELCWSFASQKSPALAPAPGHCPVPWRDRQSVQSMPCAQCVLAAPWLGLSPMARLTAPTDINATRQPSSPSSLVWPAGRQWGEWKFQMGNCLLVWLLNRGQKQISLCTAWLVRCCACWRPPLPMFVANAAPITRPSAKQEFSAQNARPRLSAE